MEESIIKSAGGIVYFMENGEPRFLILKRFTKGHQVERVPPKGKIKDGEPVQDTVVREVSEETGIPINEMILKTYIGTLNIRKYSDTGGKNFYKDIEYYLVEYTGDPDDVVIQPVEGYIGVYKWATLKEILGLIVYKNLREIFIEAYKHIVSVKKKSELLDKIIGEEEDNDEDIKNMKISFDDENIELKKKKIFK